MLTFTNSEERHNTCFQLLGLTQQSSGTTHLICNTTSLLTNTLAGNNLDTCSFYSGPSMETIMAFGESYESCGSIAYDGGYESCGSIAYDGGYESCGSIASSDSGFSGGGCDLCC